MPAALAFSAMRLPIRWQQRRCRPCPADQRVAHALRLRASTRCQHLGAARREHLRIDVRVRAMHGETRDLQLSDLDARLTSAAQARLSLIHDCAPLLLLGFFEITTLVRVAHALALVGLRRAIARELLQRLGRLVAGRSP